MPTPSLRILLLNQTFHPDVVATAQHLSRLAVVLAERGHQVTVIAGRRGYDNPETLFPAHETWRSIRINRVASTRFGKTAKWRRAADFFSFLLLCSWRLALLPRQDVVVALTSPPLISVLAACYTRLRGGRFCYWVMDLNPDEAVAAGWLNPVSLAGRALERLSRFSFKKAARIIALDRFMRDRIKAKGVSVDKIAVIPPGAHDDTVRYDEAGRERFRAAHGLQDRFVVMYSGNHSPCHPLDTLLESARRLAEQRDIVFCFVGGGSEFKRVQSFARDHQLGNVLCLPYQPQTELAGSLSAADLHVVVVGDPFVGIVHPCKIYNMLAVAAPVLYLGPEPSHVTEILASFRRPFPWARAGQGETERVVEHILALRRSCAGHERRPPAELAAFLHTAVVAQLLAAVEGEAGSVDHPTSNAS